MDIATTTLQLDTGDGKMEAYEARPKDGEANPAVIVLMEAFGLNGHIKDVTERVAREGYVAIAPDLYHRESERLVPYNDLNKAIATMNRLKDPMVMEDLAAAIAHLKSQSYSRPESIGIVGFCMGGRYAYLAAAHHKNDIKATVPYYGGGIPMGNPSPLSRTGEIMCPLTLYFGGKDPLIPQEHVEQVNKALSDSKKNFTLEIYPEATHGFFCNERESYNAEAANDSWGKTKSFFAKNLK